MNIVFKTFLFRGLVLCLIFASGCRPATEITATWTNSEAGNVSYDNVLVVAMTNRVDIKQVAEDALVEQLQARGINATRSIDEFPPSLRDGMADSKDELLRLVEEHRHDAILTVAIVDDHTETRYVPGAGGSAGFAPMGRFGYYGNFWGYYSHWAPMYQPGYYQEDRVYFIETNLYDTSSERLIWSAQSETVNPGRLDREASRFAEITINEMMNRNLFRPGPVIAEEAEEQ